MRFTLATGTDSQWSTMVRSGPVFTRKHVRAPRLPAESKMAAARHAQRSQAVKATLALRE